MVMGRDSRSEGHEFKSQHCILDGYFFTYICCKNCNVCLKRPKKVRLDYQMVFALSKLGLYLKSRSYV